MTQNLLPFLAERPVLYAERLSNFYSSTVKQGHKKDYGQFFTPVEVAQFMASLVFDNRNSISVLDPGCGVGILACALIESLVDDNSGIKKINLVVYEIDEHVLIYTKKCLEYLQVWLKNCNIVLKYKIYKKDFILENSQVIENSHSLFCEVSKFDFIICNPPYFKLPKDDLRVKAVPSIVKGQTNIYVIFMALASRLLKPDGEMIFITPRSFASGNNFKLFRKFFIASVKLKRVHLFESRKQLFSKDYISQENIILHTKNETGDSFDYRFFISSSKHIKNIDGTSAELIKMSEVIDIQSEESILNFPSNAAEYKVISIFRKWKDRLIDYGIKVSTGPVVFFRAGDSLSDEFKRNISAPMIWPHNVAKMRVVWPDVRIGRSKYIDFTPVSKSILIQNKNYVLVRRFSSKDEQNRLIAAPQIADKNAGDFIGIENRLNYIYKSQGELDLYETMGLAALLNSKIFNDYLRISNGSVNISATELRELPMPPLSMIAEIGKSIHLVMNQEAYDANEIVQKVLNVESEYIRN